MIYCCSLLVNQFDESLVFAYSLLSDDFFLKLRSLVYLARSLCGAMAPKDLRHHPYRAMSNVETPVGTQTCSWYAGPGQRPAGTDPPPDRPILIIVDYSPLQTLAHPSELDHASFTVLRRHNFRCASAGELEALFTWAQLFPPDEADTIQFTHLRPQLTTRFRTQWDIRMVPSDLEFRYADLTGDVFHVRNDWTIMQLLIEYRPEWRIRQYSCRQPSPLVPGTQQPFILRLTCHKVRQGVIFP